MLTESATAAASAAAADEGHEYRHDVRLTVRLVLSIIASILAFCLLMAAIRLCFAIHEEMNKEEEEEEEEEEEGEKKKNKSRELGGESDEEGSQASDENNNNTTRHCLHTLAADGVEMCKETLGMLGELCGVASCAGWAASLVDALTGRQRGGPSAQVVISVRNTSGGAPCGLEAAQMMQLWLQSKGLSCLVHNPSAHEVRDDAEELHMMRNCLLFVALVDDAWAEDESKLRTLALAYHCRTVHAAHRPSVFVYYDPSFRYMEEIGGRGQEQLGHSNSAVIPQVEGGDVDKAYHALLLHLPDESAPATPKAAALSKEQEERHWLGVDAIAVGLVYHVSNRRLVLDTDREARISARREERERELGKPMRPSYTRPPIKFQPLS
mmetsp:Transcript_2359/g.4716  ORF Transcript_2359/g.4716 Transcript_2359/m.4716 type:complete len:382 (-) Transcript_2359:209-1354(-)